MGVSRTVSLKGQTMLSTHSPDDATKPRHQSEIELRGSATNLRAPLPPRNHGLVALLLACPLKDSYVPMPPESNDHVAPASVTGQ